LNAKLNHYLLFTANVRPAKTIERNDADRNIIKLPPSPNYSCYQET